MDSRKRNSSPSGSQSLKKIKLPHDESIELDLFNTVLNDDCILEILNFLALPDLCTVSETCVRLKHLVNNQVKRKYLDGLPTRIAVWVNDDGEIALCPETLRNINVPVKHFVGCIPDVYIAKTKQKHVVKLMQFMQSNWNGNLKYLRFSYGFYIDSIQQNFEAMLKDVEVLRFICVSKRFKAVNDMLKYCPHLEILQIDKGFIPAAGEYTECPKLDIVQCNVVDQHTTDRLTKFITKNPSVSKLVCTLDKTWKMNLNNVVKLLSTMNSITGFYLKIQDTQHTFNDTDLQFVYQELKKLDKMDHLNRLELSINSIETLHSYNYAAKQPANSLRMDKLQKLIGLDADLSISKPLIDNQFDQLQTLRLFMLFEDDEPMIKITKKLPSLEEVHLVLYEIRDSHFEFIAQLPKLRKFVLQLANYGGFEFYNRVYGDMHSRMSSLNEQRKKLQHASKVIIFLLCVQNEHYRGSYAEFLAKPWNNKDSLVSLRTAALDHFAHTDNLLLPTILYN